MKSITNKTVHLIIFAVFSFSCWLTWLTLTQGMLHIPGHPIPWFSALCYNLHPVLLALPILALVYCLCVWFRKSDKVPSWLGFFAAAVGSFMLFGFPAVVAVHFALEELVAGLPK